MAALGNWLNASRERANLVGRIVALEKEVQECRQLNVRVAEMLDVVAELLVPLSQQDPERAQQLIADYKKSLGNPQG